MTHIDFYSNAPNRLEYVARLLQKVHDRNQTAVVLGAVSILQSLSPILWQMRGFLAHDIKEVLLTGADSSSNVTPNTAQFSAIAPNAIGTEAFTSPNINETTPASNTVIHTPHLSAASNISTTAAAFVLTTVLDDDLPHRDILINLTDTQPALFAQFQRLIEIVPDEPLAKQHARERWKNYKNSGYPVEHHDIRARRVK